MIAKLIRWCVGNRAMVVMLTLFVLAGGIWSTFNITVDAIPDLSDVQVIIRTEYPGQAPQIVEDQVTYPLTTAMLAVPHADVVRGYSMFGTSFVYIIFEDGTDMYWARSRVLEQLNFVSGKLPPGVSPQLGPDATGVGWIYAYVLVTGGYCPDHPNGLWHDPVSHTWFDDPLAAGDDPAIQSRLVRHRVFPEWPPAHGEERYDTCPLDGRSLERSEVDLSDLRGLQDWYLRYELTAVDGVSEVAAVGGFVKQYQVVVDPVRLLAYDIPLGRIKHAIRRSNVDVGGRLIEMSETEFMVRGMGYLGTLTDAEIAEARAAGRSLENARTERALDQLGKVSLGASPDGRPIYLADLADVRLGPEIRRGIAEWNGAGEAVGGIIVMRFGGNARDTINNVRSKLAELETGLPPGVGLEVGYDRSDLITRAVGTVRNTLIEEIIVVSIVIVLFLLHARSALVAVFVLPTGVLASLAIMDALGINANIMSLGGIAISIGVMVDSAVVMVENAHKHLEREKQRVAQGEPPRPRSAVIGEAAAEVGPTLFFSLLIITVSFLPIFALGEQSGRLFKPLAYTKTFAMAAAAVLAVTIIPVLMVYLISERVVPKHIARPRRLLIYTAAIFGPAFVLAVAPLSRLAEYRWWIVGGWIVISALITLPQRVYSEQRNPLSVILQKIYHPFFVFVMHHRILTLAGAALLMAATAWPLRQLGSEFMPPLEEGDLLYMPTTDPGISSMKARELLQQTDRIILQFPEVQSVFGKIGRAETATDPAPLSMIETTITLRRDKSHWRTVPVDRFYGGWPAWLAAPFRLVLPDTRTITFDELVYGYDWPDGTHVPGLNEVIQIPGLTNSWTMPIKTRIDMLSTGIKTPVGVKVMGPDLRTLAEISKQIAQIVQTAEGTGAYTVSAFPEKSVGGKYLDIRINRDKIARYGLNVADVQDVIMSAMGGMNVTWTIEGLERYPVNLRYPHELRDNLPALKQTLVAAPSGAQVPLAQLASFELHEGPPMVKSENARLTSWVFVDIAGIDVGTYVANAQRAVAEAVDVPQGYNIIWSGQYEYMQAARARLLVIVPLAAVLIVVLLYMATSSWLRVGLLLLSLPFSMVGAIWLLYLLEYNLSLAVWVGVIALAGLAAETGLVMLLYLDNSFERFKAEGRMRNADDLWYAVHDGAVQRIRPKTMTVVTTLMALLPLLWAAGAGADTMRRLAVPMIGGLITAYIGVLLILPVLYAIAKRAAMHREFRRQTTGPDPDQAAA
ncbi:MAG: efflux RND transporter permease subunit [Planctomycetota bacterium]|jgi:Cu(I)/Ag(I) efflux system membrane protein CusA/SilA